MSDERSPKSDLRERLLWLRTLGVDAIASPAPGVSPGGAGKTPEFERSAAVSRGTAAETGSQTVTQAGLFGSQAPPVSTPAATGKGRRGRSPASPDRASPIGSVKPPDAADAATGLSLIRDDLGDCRRCRLHEKRTNIVFGVGDPNARLMFIGEGPGADEDRRGEPFVGRAGQLLTRIIEAMGLRRDQVYIANVVKCRPPENRTPLPDEVITCSPFLFQQVATIRPRVVVCLGTPAAQTVLATRETITRMRGKFREVDGISIMPTFHPAYLLRNPAAKRAVWDDMKKVIALLQSEA